MMAQPGRRFIVRPHDRGQVVDELPPGTLRALAAIAGDPVSDAAEAGELLDIEVDELAGAYAAVTPRRPSESSAAL
jgi:hypothetical protein